MDAVVDPTTQHGLVLSVIENNYEYFYEWADMIPFFAKIERDGIDIIGQN